MAAKVHEDKKQGKEVDKLSRKRGSGKPSGIMITDELREELNQVAASNGQVYANLKGLSSNENVANNAMLGCSLKEISEKLDRHNKKGAASGAEKYEGQLSPKVLVMQPILRFLQLQCEYHNRELQDRDLEWFPRLRAKSLAADEGEGEQVESKSLQSQLESTQQLVKCLPQQLVELRDQNHLHLYIQNRSIFSD